MSHVIKLRAWDGEKMLEPVELKELLRAVMPNSNAINGEFVQKHLRELTWLQFTGLTDKNGQEIYEGDVIAVTDGGVGGSLPTTCQHEVYWLDSISGFALRALGGGLTAQDQMAARQYFVSEIAKGEVIGNIYENPELLEGK